MKEIPIPKNKDEEISMFISHIKSLLNDYSNEMPEEMLNGAKIENHTYKVRTNWFQGVVGCIGEAARKKYLPVTFGEELNTFLEAFKARRIKNTNLIRTTKEEIDTADNLLLRAQEYLEKK